MNKEEKKYLIKRLSYRKDDLKCSVDSTIDKVSDPQYIYFTEESGQKHIRKVEKEIKLIDKIISKLKKE